MTSAFSVITVSLAAWRHQVPYLLCLWLRSHQHHADASGSWFILRFSIIWFLMTRRIFDHSGFLFTVKVKSISRLFSKQGVWVSTDQRRVRIALMLFTGNIGCWIIEYDLVGNIKYNLCNNVKRKKCIITFNQKPCCKCSLKIILFFIYTGALSCATMLLWLLRWTRKGKKGLTTCFKFEYRSDIETQQTN